MNIVLTLQKQNIPVFDKMFSSSSSLQKCIKHTSIITFLLPDVNIYIIYSVKTLSVHHLLCPRLHSGGIKQWWMSDICLSDVCRSVCCTYWA